MEYIKNKLQKEETPSLQPYNNYKARLWNPSRFIILGIFFSFLPAAVLYSLNFGRAGNKRKRNIYLASSLILFILLFLIASYIDKAVTNSLFVGLNAGLSVFMFRSQRELYNTHIKNGGGKASFIIPVVLSLIFVGLFIALFIFSANFTDNQKVFNGSDVYYTKNVSMEEVNKLGQFLVDKGLFSDKHISVKLDKRSDLYIFSIMVDKKYKDDMEVEKILKNLGRSMSTEIFNNSKVEVEICDNKFDVLKTIPYNELK